MFGNDSFDRLQQTQSPTLNADINYLKMDECEFQNSCFQRHFEHLRRGSPSAQGYAARPLTGNNDDIATIVQGLYIPVL